MTFDASSFSLLDVCSGAALEHDPEAPLPYAVWFGSEILGAGQTPDEAIDEARATVRHWASLKLV